MAATSFSTPLTLTTQNQPENNTKHPRTTTGSFRLCKNMKEIKQLHARVTKKGLRRVSYLISSCAEIATPESLDYAKKAYELYENDFTSRLSLYLLNSLIKGYSAAGFVDAAMLIYVKMVGKGLTPDQFTFRFALNGCAKAAFFLEGIQLHGSVLKLGSEEDLFVQNCLIRLYLERGEIDAVLLIYEQMIGKGLTPDNYTFQFLLNGCAKAALFREGIQLHGSVLKSGLEEDLFVNNCLINFYAECGEIDLAKKVFDEMSERDAGSWNCLICGCARRDSPKEAVSLFFEMVEAGFKPNSFTLVGAISACAKLRDLDSGERVSAYISETGITVDTFVVNALVHMYMKCQATDRANQLFQECVEKDLESYNTLVSNYVGQGMEREALAILVEMLQGGLRPDRVTMVSVASAISQLGDFAVARQFHGYVMRNGLDDWDIVGNATINMYASCGKQEWACRVFDQMSTKSVVSWNSLLAGFARNNDVDSAWELFNEMPETDAVTWSTMIKALVDGRLFDDAIELFRVMQSEGVKANKVTIKIIASACGYLGDLDLAKWVFHCIENQGIHRDLKLNNALADMFIRCGDTESAMQLFDNVKNIDVSSWTRVIEILNEIPKRSSDQEDKSSKF